MLRSSNWCPCLWHRAIGRELGVKGKGQGAQSKGLRAKEEKSEKLKRWCWVLGTGCWVVKPKRKLKQDKRQK